MYTAVRTWRLVGALLIIAALAANIVQHVHVGDFAFFDTLGYFSQQSNILAAAVLLVALPRTGKPRPAWLEYARASVAMYSSRYAVVLCVTSTTQIHVVGLALFHASSCELPPVPHAARRRHDARMVRARVRAFMAEPPCRRNLR